MKKTIIVNTLDAKSINKAYTILQKIAYNLNFKKISKTKFSDLNTLGHKVLSTKHNINTIGDMSKLTTDELQKLKGIGPRAVSAISLDMATNGVYFKYPKAKSITESKDKFITKSKAKAKPKAKAKTKPKAKPKAVSKTVHKINSK